MASVSIAVKAAGGIANQNNVFRGCFEVWFANMNVLKCITRVQEFTADGATRALADMNQVERFIGADARHR